MNEIENEPEDVREDSTDQAAANNQVQENTNLGAEEKVEQPVIKKGRSVVILPPLQPAKPLQPAMPKQTRPVLVEHKPARIRHTVPVVAQFRPNVAKPEEKAPSKFQPTAELVRKFHKATPERFHSVPVNQSKYNSQTYGF